ncbi:MAG: hypothetical protein U5K31_04075 [Balneolaceae bacterium]|nr:hypothetical protein [Balneolaceae bacterium]
MITWVKKARGLLILLLGLFLIQGCSDESNSESTGSFTIEITGDVNKTIEGTAIFGGATDPETNQSGFVLVMSTADDPEQSSGTSEGVWIGTDDSDRPGEGTYSLLNTDNYEEGDSGFWGFSFLNEGQQMSTIIYSTSGSVEITSSSSDNVSGTFTMQAEGFRTSGQGSEEITVTLSGDFSAIGGNAFVPGSF